MNNIDKLLLDYKNNPSYELYSSIMDILYPSAIKCRCCRKHIFYKDTKLTKSRIIGKSFLSVKQHGETLTICEECLSKEFPNYNQCNKSRIFNTLSPITIYAFNITNTIPYKTGVTLEKLIKKYGDIEGLNRWNSYKNKQAYTNSLEYKKEKYGWSEEEFNDFNKSRGITLDNLILKYGEKEGSIKWQSYLDKQKLTKSKSYMINKYGLEKTNKINKSKALTLNNFINKYGDINGPIKFNTYLERMQSFYSKSSQLFFDKIDDFLNKNFTTYYATKNNEFGLSLSIGYIKLDYFIKELNLTIEYNGNRFHANPKMFESNDCPNPYNTNLTSEEIWKRDKDRYESLYKEKNINTLVVWEDEVKNILENLQEFINNKILIYDI